MNVGHLFLWQAYPRKRPDIFSMCERKTQEMMRSKAAATRATFLLPIIMQLFGKLSRGQRGTKIACVATLTQVMRQQKKSQKKIAKNSVS